LHGTALPPRSSRYSSGHFDGKPELLDRIGMPFAPKVDQDLRQPTPQDQGPVHPRMAAGAERHQLGVVAGAAVLLRLWGEGRRGSSRQKRNAEGRSGRALASRKRRPKVSSTAQAQANIE